MKKGILRDYQREIITRVHRAWNHHRSVMVQMPTGTGKTHVLAEIVNNRVSGGAGKVLVVAHRIELVAQIRETVDAFFALAQQHVGAFAKALDDIGDRITSVSGYGSDDEAVDLCGHRLSGR